MRIFRKYLRTCKAVSRLCMFFIFERMYVKKITDANVQYAQKRIAKIIKMHGIVLRSEFLVKSC